MKPCHCRGFSFPWLSRVLWPCDWHLSRCWGGIMDALAVWAHRGSGLVSDFLWDQHVPSQPVKGSRCHASLLHLRSPRKSWALLTSTPQTDLVRKWGARGKEEQKWCWGGAQRGWVCARCSTTAAFLLVTSPCESGDTETLRGVLQCAGLCGDFQPKLVGGQRTF